MNSPGKKKVALSSAPFLFINWRAMSVSRIKICLQWVLIAFEKRNMFDRIEGVVGSIIFDGA